MKLILSLLFSYSPAWSVVYGLFVVLVVVMVVLWWQIWFLRLNMKSVIFVLLNTVQQ